MLQSKADIMNKGYLAKLDKGEVLLPDAKALACGLFTAEVAAIK